MAVKGKSAEFTDYSKKVGLFEGKILAFNPEKEELEKILGTEIKKDPEYLKEDQEGNDMCILTIWVEDVKSGMKKSCKIPLIDTPLTTKDGSKTKFINIQGNISYYVDKKENLMSWFNEFESWQCRRGEDQLYTFLKAWLQIDTFHDKTAEMSVDFKKLLKGNIKELKSFIGSEYDHTVLFNQTISTVTKEDEEGNEVTREYENLYNRDFLPGSAIKFFNLGGKLPKFVQKYVDNCAYGIKDFYIMEPLQDYSPDMNKVSTDEAVLEEDGSDY